MKAFRISYSGMDKTHLVNMEMKAGCGGVILNLVFKLMHSGIL
jgi:hypothetical protein